jgi:Arc/MetJ-type ribon-helix-helix transcriptional regulator
MSRKVSITLDDEVLQFVDQHTRNRSSFINALLLEEKRRIFMQELAKAYEQQENDLDFQQEISTWEVTVDDGLDA